MSGNLSKLKVLRTFRKLSCFHSQLLLLRGSSVFRSPQMPDHFDPFPLFMKEEVQTIMNNITGIDLSRSAQMNWSNSPSKSTIRVVPDDELKEIQAKAVKRERSKIEQRPPFMKPREEINQELSRDPDIAPIMTHNLLFIDISSYTRPESANKEKVVVMRDTEGTLRQATQEERDRAIQIAFPVRDRKVVECTFFKPEHLQNALKNCRYNYILEKVCIQYDPDHPEFIKLSTQIFDHILEKQEFDTLRGTRHFGSMAFYFALCRREVPLVVDMLRRKLLLDACDYVQLYWKMYPSYAARGHKSITFDEPSVKSLMNTYVKQQQYQRELKSEWNSLCEAGLSEIIQENLTQRNLINSYLEM